MSDPEVTVLPLSAGLDATARAWLEAGSPPGPVPRQSASVVLLRDGDGGTEVLWITRGRSLAVAPGQLAFPGGAVDAEDRRRRHDDLAPPDRFTVLARAAARELAEETGHAVPAQVLRPLARWVTPEHEPRRFDATFLVGVLPDQADPDPSAVDGEVHEHGWAPPGLLLEQVASGVRGALPPTRAVLARLHEAVTGTGAGAGAGSVDAARAVAHLVRTAVLVPVVPRATWREEPGHSRADRGVDLLLPRHAGDVP